MGHHRRPPEGSRRQSRRDRFWVAGIAAAVFIVGIWLGAFEQAERWMDRRVPHATGDALALLVLISAALAGFAVKRRRQGVLEHNLRLDTERRYRALVEQSPGVTYTWDPSVPTGEAKPLFVSPQIEDVLGYTPEEWTGTPTFWIDRVHPEDRARVIEASNHADRTGEPFCQEYRTLAKDGRIVWLRDEATVVREAHDGSARRSQGVMYDITRQKEAEGKLQEAESRYRTMVERVPAVSYIWDSRHQPGSAPATYISPQIERLLGYAPEEWLSDPGLWTQLVELEDQEPTLAAWARAAAGGGSFAGEYRMRHRDGHTLWIRDEAVPVAAGEDGHAVYQGVMIDVTARHEVEDQLRETEGRYRTLVEQLPVITYVSDKRGLDEGHVVRYVAPGIEGLTGVTAEEWVARDGVWERLIHPADRDRVLAESRRTDETAEPFDMEYRMLRADGRTVWVRDQARIVEAGPDGLRSVWQGVFEDITARKATEKLLRDTEERFRRLVEQIPAVTYVEDPATGKNLYISPQVEPMFGFTAEEWQVNSRLWEERLHPDDRDRVIAENEADMGDTWSVDYRSITRDGRTIWVHNDARLIRDDEGAPLYWQGVVFDITERKEAEERLTQAEARYRTLVEQLPAVVYVDAVDDVATALYVSPQYERLTGYTAEERLTQPELWLRCLHPDDRERVVEESHRTDSTGDPFDVEYRLITKDGRVIWVHDHAYQVDGPGGGRVWQGVLTDITQRKVAEETLERRDLILQAAGLAAERFLRAPTWGECINEVIERVGLAGDASRAYVYRNEEDGAGQLWMQEVFEWTAAGVPPSVQMAGEPSYAYRDGFERWLDVLGSGGVVHGLTSQITGAERRWMEAEEVLSCLAVPVFVGSEWWGYIGYDQCEEERMWQPAEVEALRVVANTLGAAIGRERAAQQLAESETRYQTLIEQLPAITYMVAVGPPVRTVYISPQIERLLGYAPEDWNAERWKNSLHPDDAERVLAEDARTSETGEPFVQEYRLASRSGAWVWVRDEAHLIRDEAGGPMYWQGVRSDITEQKEAERQLRDAEERFRLLVEQLPVITYVDERDPGRRGTWPTIYISPQVTQILGYEQEEWKADPHQWNNIVLPEDQAIGAASNEDHYGSGRPLDIELRVYHKDGSIRWIRDQAVVIRDELGEPRWSQGILMDVTDRRVAEEQLREAEARYRAIVEHVPAAIYVDQPDASLETIYISPQIAEISGISVEEWIDDPDAWVRAIHPDDREAVVANYRRTVGTGQHWRAEYRFLRKDGSVVWVHDETTFILDEDGERRFLQGVIYDITERKLAEQALRESEQRERDAAERLRALDEMKNTFLAAVSHELRSPLTSILGLSLTLERTRDMNDRDREDLLERLSANARKLDRLLKDLLDIDRLSRGIVEPQYRVIDVGALVRRTVENVDALTDRAVDVNVESVVVPVDPAKVERIVENLLVNAARHTSPDRSIWVSVSPHEGGVLLAVDDNGPGVPPDLRDAIFEPFRQGPTASPHSPGTGIGLSLVSRFAELHGGRAWVEDRAGGGASFRVFLPGRRDPGVESSGEATSTNVNGHGAPDAAAASAPRPAR